MSRDDEHMKIEPGMPDYSDYEPDADLLDARQQAKLDAEQAQAEGERDRPPRPGWGTPRRG